MATNSQLSARWQEYVKGLIAQSPTRWAMMSHVQRDRAYDAFVAAYIGGIKDGYEAGERDTQHIAAVLGVLEPDTLYNWGMGYLKHGRYVTGFKTL